jgi:hypothetical protein
MKNLTATICLTISVLLLGGCAGNEGNIYGCCVGQKVVGNKNYVTVWNVRNEMDALPLAEGHCAKYKKSASYKSKESMRVIFDCVE